MRLPLRYIASARKESTVDLALRETRKKAQSRPARDGTTPNQTTAISSVLGDNGGIKVRKISTGNLVPPRLAYRYTQIPSAPGLGTSRIQQRRILTLTGIDATRDWIAERKADGRKVGLVPTMGALHQGHLDLVQRAAEECDDVIVSIYVNPTQFGPSEDLSSYPRPFVEDCAKLDNINRTLDIQKRDTFGRVRAVFNPHTLEMYPRGVESQSRLTIDPALTQRLEGAARPHFFEGVTTVVLKLLNIVQPHAVFFGQKDIQQLVVIRRMLDEFHIPVRLRAVRTRRESDGLAMSSRNIYLGERRRRVATALHKVLHAGVQEVNKLDDPQGTRRSVPRETVVDAMLAQAVKLQQEQQALPPSQRARFEIDYLSLADTRTLKDVDFVDPRYGAILCSAMVMLPLEEPQDGEVLGLGDDKREVRLIDNLLLQPADRLFGLTDKLFRWNRRRRGRRPIPVEGEGSPSELEKS